MKYLNTPCQSLQLLDVLLTLKRMTQYFLTEDILTGHSKKECKIKWVAGFHVAASVL